MVLVAGSYWASEAKEYAKMRESPFRRVYVYCETKNVFEALAKDYGGMRILSLEEIFFEVDETFRKPARRENPKFLHSRQG